MTLPEIVEAAEKRIRDATYSIRTANMEIEDMDSLLSRIDHGASMADINSLLIEFRL